MKIIFDVQNITFEDGYQLNSKIMTLKNEIKLFNEKINDLKQKSKNILPLNLQNNSITVGQKVVSNFSIDGQKIMLEKGKMFTLIDNSNPYNWQVQTDCGQKFSAPNLCFSLLPPDEKSLNLVKKLQNFQKK